MYNIVKEGLNGITVKVVADSMSHEGKRITTFELDYHRYIHSEIMTHRVFSRNAMSSRAVPFKVLKEQVEEQPATPVYWGENKAGMQAGSEVINPVELPSGTFDAPDLAWKEAAGLVAEIAQSFADAGYHKQIVNRIIEPFQMMKVVLTATDFANFFWLRLAKEAAPEIQELARLMWEAYFESQPEALSSDEWHTPYVEHFRNPHTDELSYFVMEDNQRVPLTEHEALAISSSCCAQISYRNIDNSYKKAMSIYERLGVGTGKIHASPFEHQAKPMNGMTNPEGATHILLRNGQVCSGNLQGWIQHRQLLTNHTKW